MLRKNEELEKELNIFFDNKEILNLALTHSSYANEQGLKEYNERLEFLGDAVLQLCITEYLYENCRENDEGDLTRQRSSIVCEASLYEIGKLWKLGDYIKLSRGEALSGGNRRVSIIADTVEAVIAAIYIDKGFEFTCKFILKFFKYVIDKSQVINYLDHKTRLQEFVQSKSTDKIRYNLLKEEGPSHRKTFYVQVCIGEKEYGFGEGSSKKEAEQNAAENTLKILGF